MADRDGTRTTGAEDRSGRIFLQLRIDFDLHARATRAAVEDRRNLNSELLWLIELGLKGREQARMLERKADEYIAAHQVTVDPDVD